ncbi:MAG TPA: sulfatase-like hydrolase/transferase [Mycobacteriales bacterium]|nr:sulfatase-like hydrolase/transferase [Mycobacteriales bacterium]
MHADTDPVGPPNIVLIVVDQQRLDCLGRTSPELVSTPNIDGLAAGGAWFANAFTHIPTCCPARQSLLHGGRPESFGGLWNYDVALPVPGLSPEHPTWTAALSGSGYDSIHLGKWHVSPTATPGEFGYGAHIGLEDYALARDAAGVPAAGPVGWEGGIDPAPLPFARTHWFARQAADWIGTRPESAPWYLHLDLTEPHLPCTPVEEFAKKYRDRDTPPWPNVTDPLEGKPYIQRQQRLNWQVQDWTWERWQELVRSYLAVIEQVDDAVGMILDAVADIPNTAVVFTADHGDLTGSHGMMDKHYVMYDELVRVPLIVRWPERIRAGRIVEELVYNLLDTVPTIYAAAGLPVPEQCVGRDLLPLLDGGTDSWRDSVVATYNGNQFGLYTQRMLRTHRWKYVWNATDVDELYDLQNDPAELHNVSGHAGNADLLGELRRSLLATLEADGDRQVANSWIRGQLTGGWKL